MRYIIFTLAFLSLLPLFGQHRHKVDFIRAKVFLEPLPMHKKIEGAVTYEFKVLQNVDSVFFDAKNMDFSEVLVNNRKTKHSNDGKTITLRRKFRADRDYTVHLKYAANPKQTVYFLGWEDSIASNEQIWTQGQGKYTSHWLPSFDDMNEKVEFDLTIAFDTGYTVIANGKLRAKEKIAGRTTWSYNMEKPMSSYLLAFAIGNYEKEKLKSETGNPIELYHYPKDSLRVEPTYRYTRQIFDFLEQEIGVPYPWQNYKQVPVRDFLYAGMENTGTTIFSDGYVVDSIAFVDKNYVNVNAHEMAHQWFGNLVTEADGNHHWLHEGFATYYAYLAEKEVFGDEYFYWRLYETALQLRRLTEQSGGEALTDPKASSLTFYEKGAWALHVLREMVGDKAFKTGVKNYLQKFSFENVVIDDFLDEIGKSSGTDLSGFKEKWLQGTAFPFDAALEKIKNASESLNSFLKLRHELTTSTEPNQKILRRYWDSSPSTFLRKKIIRSYAKSLSGDVLKEAFDTQDMQIRGALVESLDRIPPGLETEYESLLQDQSYVTIARALYNLWVYRPENRSSYLEKTKNIFGLPNANVRIPWLLLAILTKDYLDENDRKKAMSELFQYTSPEYPFEIRINAFAHITEVFPLPDDNLRDLINATVHHSWQFRKFARNLLGKIMEDDKERERVKKLSQELKGEELRYVKSKLMVE